MPRYVILRHDMPSGDARGLHWDLMLEASEVLRTWALEAEPLTQASINAMPLADHRLAYLEYEGPVSGNRGSVTRWDQGVYSLISESETVIELSLEGARLQGPARLTRGDEDGHFWVVSFGTAPVNV